MIDCFDLLAIISKRMYFALHRWSSSFILPLYKIDITSESTGYEAKKKKQNLKKTTSTPKDHSVPFRTGS